MVEDLRKISEEIEALEQKLQVLRAQELELRDQILASKEYIGKYIKWEFPNCIKYFRIDRFKDSSFTGTFLMEGPFIEVIKQDREERYELDSLHLASSVYLETPNFVSKEEFDSVLKKAIKNFKI